LSAALAIRRTELAARADRLRPIGCPPPILDRFVIKKSGVEFTFDATAERRYR